MHEFEFVMDFGTVAPGKWSNLSLHEPGKIDYIYDRYRIEATCTGELVGLHAWGNPIARQPVPFEPGVSEVRRYEYPMDEGAAIGPGSYMGGSVLNKGDEAGTVRVVLIPKEPLITLTDLREQWRKRREAEETAEPEPPEAA